MSRLSKFLRLQTDGVKGAALAVVLGLCFFVFSTRFRTDPANQTSISLGDGLAHLSYEVPFLFRKDIEVTNVAIIYMDEASHRRLEQPFDKEWRRSLMADLVRTLTACQAKAIVFDVLFEEPSNRKDDGDFIQAVTSHGKVAVSEMVTPQSHGGLIVYTISEPFAALKAATAPGLVEAAVMTDPIVRKHYAGASGEPTLVCRVAELTMTNPPPRLPDKARWMNYYGPPLSLPHYSFYQVLDKKELINLVQLFSNKVVFVGSHIAIGFTAGRPTEYFRTPYSLWTKALSPGVEINATAFLNLYRNDWLTEMSVPSELMLLIVCGLTLGYGLTQCRPTRAMALGLSIAVLVAGAAIVLMWQTRIWFPWLIVCAVQMPTALGWSVLAYSKRLHLEREALAEQVSAQPAGAAPTPGGSLPEAPAVAKFAERYIHASAGLSSGMPPGRDGLTRLDEDAAPPIPDHTLLRCIGRGAYGRVWIARDAIGTYHAVKVIYRNNFKDDSPFDREFRGIQKFTPISRSHPGFVHILHVGRNEEAGYFYYIMELGDDVTAGQQIDPNTYSPQNLALKLKQFGKLPIAECLQISVDLASALDYLHQRQLIHRDIKPSNIIFVNHQPKFADIGLVTDMASADSDASFVGTQGYLAPEGPGTAAADVYSLGKLLYEVSTGFDRSRFPELPSALMKSDDTLVLFQLNKIILRACETDPPRRYQSAAAMREDLVQLQQGGSVEKKKRFWRRA